MDNQTSAMSGGVKMVIGAIVAIVVIGGAVMLFSKDKDDVSAEVAGEQKSVEKTEANGKTTGAVESAPATTKTAEIPATKPANTAPTTVTANTEANSSITSMKKAAEVLATGKDTICTSKVIPNSGSSVKYQFADGNTRIDTLGAGVEAHAILLKSGKSYQWSNMYEGVMTGGQYDASAKILLQSPLFGYTCVEQDVSASVFVPPAK